MPEDASHFGFGRSAFAGGTFSHSEANEHALHETKRGVLWHDVGPNVNDEV